MNRLAKLFVAVAVAVIPAACKDDVRKDADRAAENLADQKEDLNEESKELKNALKEQAEDTREAQADRVDDDAVAGLPERANGRLDESEIKRNANEIKDESEDVAAAAKDVKTASNEFDEARLNRVNQLRATHQVIAAQPQMLNVFAGITPLTDRARADLSEKMQIFQMRIDEAGNAIEALQGVDERNFEERNDTAAKAMERLEEAGDDAWEALNDGDLIEPS